MRLDARFEGILLILFLFLAMLLSGCASIAIGRKANYSYAWPNITYKSSYDIVIGIIDNRPYVLSGKVAPTYVGLMRGGYGNPFYMHTESGEPLADDLAQAVVSGFRNAGINARSVKLAFDLNQSEINNSLISIKSSRKVLIFIKEWKGDSGRTTSFLYDLTVKVYDEKGTLLADYSEKNTNKDRIAVVSTLDAGRDAFTKILNEKSISDALRFAKEDFSAIDEPPVPQTPENLTQQTFEKRLQTLNHLMEKKLISKDEYDRRKAEILSEL